ncbi:MAG: DivIVA domain-containing protein [Gemmatimonadota bacterium]
MIDLTPLEVRKKKGDFRKAMRGYDPQAVDDFLDLVADRLEQLVRENVALNERASSVGSQVSDYRERERALTEALVTAQEMRQQMRQQIEREVELKRREAAADAEAIRTAAAQVREREDENIRRLRARQTQFVQSYRAFLERELAEIGVIAQTLNLFTEETAEPSAPRKRGKQAEAAPEPAPLAVMETEAEAAVARDVRIEDDYLIDLTMHLPAVPDAVSSPPASASQTAQMDFGELPVEEEAAELELLDEVEEEEEEKKDADNDGWVSSLLEGKGD